MLDKMQTLFAEYPEVDSAHWASLQAFGRTSHCGAPDDEDRNCRKKKKTEKTCHITNHPLCIT